MKTDLLFCFPGKKSFEIFLVPTPQKTGLNKLINWIRFWVSRMVCAMGRAIFLILGTFDAAAEGELGCILPPWLISLHSRSLQCLSLSISTADLAEIGPLLFSLTLPDSLLQCDSSLAMGQWAAPLLSPPSTLFCCCWFCATFCSSFLHWGFLVFAVNRSNTLEWGWVSLPSLIFWHWSECFSNIISAFCLAFLLDTILLTTAFGLVISLVFLEQVFKSLLFF